MRVVVEVVLMAIRMQLGSRLGKEAVEELELAAR
jgi:hypothetical protein